MKKKTRAIAIIAVVLVLYVGSYALLVTPAPLNYMTGIFPTGTVPSWPRVPHYQYGGKLAEVLFTPAVAVDKKLFPRRWRFVEGDKF